MNRIGSHSLLLGSTGLLLSSIFAFFAGPTSGLASGTPSPRAGETGARAAAVSGGGVRAVGLSTPASKPGVDAMQLLHPAHADLELVLSAVYAGAIDELEAAILLHSLIPAELEGEVLPRLKQAYAESFGAHGLPVPFSGPASAEILDTGVVFVTSGEDTFAVDLTADARIALHRGLDETDLTEAIREAVRSRPAGDDVAELASLAGDATIALDQDTMTWSITIRADDGEVLAIESPASPFAMADSQAAASSQCANASCSISFPPISAPNKCSVCCSGCFKPACTCTLGAHCKCWCQKKFSFWLIQVFCELVYGGSAQVDGH